MSRLDLAVSRTTNLSHHKTTLTCTAEMTFNVAKAREALDDEIAVKVYSQPDNVAMLLGALENGDTHVLDTARASYRATWLAKSTSSFAKEHCLHRVRKRLLRARNILPVIV